MSLVCGNDVRCYIAKFDNKAGLVDLLMLNFAKLLRAKELRDKDDALHAHASVNAQLDHLKHSASKASNFASRLEQFEAQQQKLEEEAAKDRSRLHLEMASAEARATGCYRSCRSSRTLNTC